MIRQNLVCKNNFLKQEDVDLLTVVDTYEEALDIIKKVSHVTFKNMR